jgi:hypothetical protein
MLQSFSRTGLWAFLVPAIFLAAESTVSGQPMKLRGPPPMPKNGMAPQPLLPPRQDYAPAVMNNGSLQTTQNPNANLPNQARFIYIAAMPLGDRLGNNGVYYDTNILPNIGLFQGGQNLFNMQNQQNNQLLMNQNNNNNNQFNPFNPNQFNAARMARQQMMMGVYASYVMQMQQATAMQSGFLSANYTMQMQQAMTMYGDASGFGWFDPSINGPNPTGGGAAGVGGFTTPLNNQGFGAGFRNVSSGF